MTIERVSPPDQMNPECRAPSGPCICGHVFGAGAKGATFATTMPTADYIVKPALRRADGVVDARIGLTLPFTGSELITMIKDKAAEFTRHAENAKIDAKTREAEALRQRASMPAEYAYSDEPSKYLNATIAGDYEMRVAHELLMVAGRLDKERTYELSLLDLQALRLYATRL